MNLNLADRMKKYENITRSHLTAKTPVIIRLDGKAFRTFTKGFEKPFDKVFMKAMQETCKDLCKNIMNCKLAYTQSDEISLLLIDYATHETQTWFDNNIQKMASVSASMATLYFNKHFKEQVESQIMDYRDLYLMADRESIPIMMDDLGESIKKLQNVHSHRFDTAMFDSRVFILPKDEVCNYFINRQQDAVRNSILGVAQSMFSDKQMDGKKCDELQDMMYTQHNINWNDYTINEKRGSCIIKEYYMCDRIIKDESTRPKWVLDENTPTFTKDRKYIDKFVFPAKEGD